MLDAVVLDHEHRVGIREIDASDECAVVVADHMLVDRRREALADEHVGEQPLGNALRDRRSDGTGVDGSAESPATGPTLGGEPRRRGA